MGVVKNYLLYILIIISIYQVVSGLDFEETDYCEFANNKECYNKTHLLCKVHHIRRLGDHQFRYAILNPINLFRANLRNSQHICNLPDFEWSQILESLAEGAVFHDNFQGYCLENSAYKNILYFNLTTIDSNSDIVSQINEIVHAPDKPAWLYSAYSTGIGCAINNTRKYVVCMINGIRLSHSDQSFGYKDDCNINIIPTMASTICSDGQELVDCDNSLICSTPLQNFSDTNIQKMPFTVKRFILHKLMNEHKNVKWNNNLEYLAEQIVTQNLSPNDKCLAIKYFPNVAAHHFEGIDRYHERISNIDHMWQTNNITQNVGCTIFTRTNGELWNAPTNTDLYCVYNFDEPVLAMWPMYSIFIVVAIVICVILIAYFVQLLFTKMKMKKCKTETVEPNPSDIYDIVDVR